ncbi:MAG: hypothetical protein A3K19_07995 [Lentisphaerae bacterium RIFOXYB12_FULL_65_16]|nr:MAG: hypothetical protein A3K18_08835 [Lentisphaerae bacterium RIFOXYA12_64_32]OGV87589.1 MAG: hypothetical protein A3K19_07995 [Lentisphaerae bacterium RIFOXYB12_FULL_65_16]
MKNVLIPTKLDKVAKQILGERGFSITQDADTPLAELIKAHGDTGALIVRSEPVTAEIIDALPNLRVIIRAGAGYDTIDTKYARRKGIDVMNTPGANANAVAEEVLAMVLAHYRHVIDADKTTRAGKWEKKKYMGRELAGKTLGIVGLGNIGLLVAQRASGFDMRRLGFDPVISARKAEDAGVTLSSLETIFRESDVVTLHVPETDETRGMVNRGLLSLMKEGATLVNCARSGIINEDDLRAARKEKKLGFCNDVYAEDEPGAKSVADIADVMLPHLGANTYEANTNAARRAAEQLVAYVERGVNKYVVNRGVPEGLDEIFQQLAFQVAAMARHYLGTDKSVRRIECSFYGGLEPYAKWLLPPILAGISSGFDPLGDPQEAEDYLAQKGITFDVRPADEKKGYGRSITVDLMEGKDPIRQVSVRGTIAEGNIVISRIDDFHKLYFQLSGHNLIVVYKDRPGVLARVTGACAAENINIEDMRAPHNRGTTKSLALVKTNLPVPAKVVERLAQEVSPEAIFALSIA